MQIVVGVLSALSTTAVLSLIVFLLRNFLLESFRHALQNEHAKFLDKLQWDRKVQEQAARVAEYLSIACRLKENSPETQYLRANQMSWELAMWLPENIYKEMAEAIVRPNEKINPFTVVIAVRRFLLQEDAGSLCADNIAHHAPGVGKKRLNT